MFENKNEIIRVNCKDLTCRNCINFVRVAGEDNVPSYYARGFCACGQGKGDFGLFVNDVCSHHAYSKYNLETWEVETKIMEKRDNMKYNALDRRTKEYRAISDIIEMFDTAEPKPDKRTVSRMLWDTAIISRAVNHYIYAIYRDQIGWIVKRRHMTYDSYVKLIARIQHEISDGIGIVTAGNTHFIEGPADIEIIDEPIADGKNKYGNL